MTIPRHLRRDLAFIAMMAAVALAGGLAINAARWEPLALRYVPKAERMGRAVESLLKPRAHENAAPAGWTQLDLEAFRRMVDRKEAVILDARPEVFYDLGHVPGALSLPREDFEARYKALRGELERDKSRPVAVYCTNADCEDSWLVAEALVKLSHPKVFVFKGGWDDWSAAGLPEEKTEAKP